MTEIHDNLKKLNRISPFLTVFFCYHFANSKYVLCYQNDPSGSFFYDFFLYLRVQNVILICLFQKFEHGALLDGKKRRFLLFDINGRNKTFFF